MGFIGQAHGEATPRYFGQNQCGIVDVTRIPPRAYIQVDLDGNGEVEHYYANWGGVERHRTQRGSNPPTLVRDAVVYSSTANQQYSCVDLRAYDVDRDGDLDLVFGSPRELVVLTNNNGRLSVSRREPQNHPPEAQVRLQFVDGQISIVFQ